MIVVAGRSPNRLVSLLPANSVLKTDENRERSSVFPGKFRYVQTLVALSSLSSPLSLNWAFQDIDQDY